MRLQWNGANVVVLARNHDPSTLSPEWIRQHQLIDEPPLNFSLNPTVSIYESNTLHIFVVAERLQVTLKTLLPVHLRTLQRVVEGYIQGAPHVSCRAVGVNLAWRATADHEGEGFQIAERLFLADPRQVEDVFPEGERKVGGLLYNVRGQYRLRLMIEPILRSNGDLRLDFNYHSDVQSPDDVLQAVRDVLHFYELSELSSRRLLMPGEALEQEHGTRGS